MKKRIVWLLLAAMLLVIAVSSAAFLSNAGKLPFTDVRSGSYYEQAVLWAVEQGVTTGTSETSFSPAAACTRGQVLTFLWRAQGKPEPASAQNTFSDVTEADYFYKPVLWAVEQGITAGTSATSFSPQSTCTRAQVITFLWRAEGKPEADGSSSLALSYQGQYYQDAVAWADTCGMLSGMGGAFNASAECPRSDIVTYLYRLSAVSPAGAASGSKRLDTQAPTAFSYADVPAYTGSAFVQINGNTPYFSTSFLTTESYELYSDLDALGRCGTAVACVGLDIMPTEERGSIGQVRPSGWHLQKYDCVEGKYLYNRCHLLGYQLTGENANNKNLITGTRYLNVEGMLPFENLIADYVEDTGNHILYRVTPVFVGSNLLASGVLLEGMSCEDRGASVQFCVFCYNVQPGIVIDYATGDSYEQSSSGTASADGGTSSASSQAQRAYVLNVSSRRFHVPGCSGVENMSAKNRLDYTGTRESVLAMGYEPCQSCQP